MEPRFTAWCPEPWYREAIRRLRIPMQKKYGSGGYNMGLKAEISDLPLKRGTIVAFTLPDKPDSAGSQFFICVGDQLQLNGQFTAFAYVADGMDIVEKISTTPTDGKRMATERVDIKSVAVRKIPPPPPPVAPPFTTETLEDLKAFQLAIETSMGKIVVEMLPDKAPNHVRHVLRLASVGAFDQTSVHRVAPGFVVQLGDLNTRKEPITQKANEFVVPIRAELNDVRHDAGIVSMARGNEIDSALTSFFIVLGPQPSLNGTYTVFGRVVEGMDVGAEDRSGTGAGRNTGHPCRCPGNACRPQKLTTCVALFFDSNIPFQFIADNLQREGRGS